VTEVVNIPTKEDILRKNLVDPVYFCESFLENWFPQPMPWFHYGLLAIWTRRCQFLLKLGPKELDKVLRHFVWSNNPFDKVPIYHPIFTVSGGKVFMVIGPFTAVMMPRGFGKTTLGNAKNIYKILHFLTNFTVYVSESGPHAEMQTLNVRNELGGNEKIIKFYGNLQGPKWGQDDFETSSGVKVVARGRGAQVRGLLHNAHRPDNITVDDLEDEESVSTDAQRKKVRDWLYKALIPALAGKRTPSRSLDLMGTLLHNDSILMTVPNDPQFNFIRFGAIDLDGDPLWADHMNLQDIEQKKQSWTLAGELAGFYMEYLSLLRTEETAAFKNSFIYDVAKDLLAIGLAIDPAISEKKKSDYFAIAAAGISASGRIFGLEEFGKVGVSAPEQVIAVFDLYKKLKLEFPNVEIKVGVESVAYQAALIHFLRGEMFRQHTYFEIQAIAARTEKIARIKGILAPRYNNGYVIHRKRLPLLESQLLDFPNGKLDVPDAMANAVALLDPYAAAEAGGKDLEADEYEEEIYAEEAP
jgi:hypothetical protein